MSILAAPWIAISGPWRYASCVASLVTSVLVLCFRPSTWRLTVRNVLARQLLFTGIEAVLFVSFVALLVGVSVVAQAQMWLTRFGQRGLLGDVLVLVIIREAAPLLTNFVVIGRSGTAIATELAAMKVSGEVHVLDAQGIEPFLYLVIPRVIGVMLSVFSLTVLFIVMSFTSGYLTGTLLGADTGQPGVFIRSVFKAIHAPGMTSLAAKTFIPGLATGAICCLEGLRVKGAVTEVPQAATRALTRSVAALFLTSAVVSVLTYL
jgi:phospholipid/cholesterol/gamma-HCH transport system permease protein